MSKKIIIIPVLAVALFAAGTAIFTANTDTVYAWDGGTGGPGGCCGGPGDGPSGGGDPGGGDPEGGGDPNPNPNPNPTPPECEYLKANGQTGTLTLPQGGGEVELRWKSNITAFVEQLFGDLGVLNPGNETVSANGSKTVTVTDDITYRFTVSNPAGTQSDSCKVNIVVEEKPEPAGKCVSFTATPSTITKGESSTLSWTTKNAETVTLTRPFGDQTVNPNDSVVVKPNRTFTFKLTVEGAGGDDTCYAKVVVEEKPDPKLPKCKNFTATPSSLPHGGGTVTLDWTTKNADTVTLNGTPVGTSGPVDRTVTTDTTFKLKVSNDYGDATCKAYVTVGDAPSLSCDDLVFTASDTYVQKGSDVTLSWVWTGNVIGATVDQGIGTVQSGDTRVVTINNDITYTTTITDGTNNKQCPLTITVKPDTKPICEGVSISASDTYVSKGTDVTINWSWTQSYDEVTVTNGIGSVSNNDSQLVTINDDETYAIKVTKGNHTETCDQVTVTVKPDETPICEGVSIKASDTSVDEGDDVTISWSWTQSYDKVEVNNGIGVVSNNDSEKVTIDNNETYKITVTDGNQTETCDSVDISARDDGGGGGGSPYPRCEEFEASDDDVQAGDRVTLRWETRWTEEITLFAGDEDDGDELFYTDDEDNVDDGEFVVRPMKDTTYTLLLERGSRDRTCDVEVEVDEDDDVVVLTDRKQEPRVAGIALTQVPYTGFEAGPVLTVLFYLLLALWGIFVAYTFTVKRDSVLGFSLAGAFPRNQAVADVSTKATDAEEETSQAAAYVANATAAAAPTNLPTGNVPTTIGYAAVSSTSEPRTIDPAVDTEETADELTDLENRAHAQRALFSSDALRHFTNHVALEEQFATLDEVIKSAKTRFPSEDHWVVINLERLHELLDTTAAGTTLDTTPSTNGSLAEAIVSGNAATALQLVGSRPMIALADATTDLDTLYRLRNGGDETVSDLLASASAHLTDAQIKEAIHALNGAMDGTYSTEADAVKTAVLKAIKAVR